MFVVVDEISKISNIHKLIHLLLQGCEKLRKKQ